MMKIWPFNRKGASRYSAASTAKEVTQGIDANGVTAVVTGATSGIGVETARTLAIRGVHVVMAVRNVNAGKNLKEKLIEEIPAAKLDDLELDLSSLASVKKFASEFKSMGLLMFSWIMATPFQLSKDNIELQFATNHLGHFHLTELLLDDMKKTALESNREGRIVNVSSEAHRFTYSEGIWFDKINDETGYSSLQTYGQSKLANILHANELARRLKQEGVQITANSLHPGSITTNLLHHHSLINGFVHTLGKFLLKDVEQAKVQQLHVMWRCIHKFRE